MKKKPEFDLRRYSGTIFLMILSILCAVVSGLLLFVPRVSNIVLCNVAAAGLIVWGIAQICRFFAVQAYRHLHDYSFSSGALLVILGCVALVRVYDVADHLEVVLQLVTLCLGVVLFQNTVQLKSVGNRLWMAEGVFSLCVILSAVLTLTQPGFLHSWLTDITHWSLLAAGVISSISFPVVAFSLYQVKKQDAAQEAARQLSKGEHPHTARLPLASFTHTDELDVEAIRAEAEKQAAADTAPDKETPAQ